ncbi:methionine ABC transporter ATP-binding protein [Bacillus aquiflavi]|uniref:Methionine ABC transporter ATP-binding protein n=1 Tax=Bacillus aquiflavi TaxID=2672567 RepID=A0A6B3VVJ8_9BACI|nr:methionine ABC transporter ATP-binding protein [Bacillus aquiflavi]MBA4535940.1 methionine ABC transporter ATP-binding protein [Bacillus aquiflavi]NEY80315.1 methionine ABC transporter ATP-binding protein [Bacillus aquiflavi]UAC50023.1 methionine ABC transporter ATP-binding protein [Bacillus aquiflavi]
MIEFQHVSKVFENNGRKVEALKDINLTVEKGDIFGVIGFSGAGKSTLIRTVNLLEKPTSGRVVVDGQNLANLSKKELQKAKKNIGMIFQHFNLLSTKTVFDNVAMPLLLSKTPKNTIKKRVQQLLTFVGLADKAKNYPNQLSGGQKQRVGIARALAANPSILLCDEATSALDPETTTSILQLLKKINKEYEITILMITHEMEVIKQICNRVAVMESGQVIEASSIIDLFSNPKTETAKNFVHSVIKNEILQSVLNNTNTNGKNSRLYHVKFIGECSSKPIFSQVAKTFAVDVNILFGNITDLRGVPFGSLTVELQGDEAEIVRAYEYIIKQNGIAVEVVNDGS